VGVPVITLIGRSAPPICFQLVILPEAMSLELGLGHRRHRVRTVHDRDQPVGRELPVHQVRRNRDRHTLLLRHGVRLLDGFLQGVERESHLGLALHQQEDAQARGRPGVLHRETGALTNQRRVGLDHFLVEREPARGLQRLRLGMGGHGREGQGDQRSDADRGTCSFHGFSVSFI
jgi:hypothetical protein